MNKPPNAPPAAAARRVILHRALAVGCGLWAPVLFSGCNKKEGGAAPAAGAPSGAAKGAMKAPKASVRYQTSPNGEQQCSKCANFIAESNTCKVVEGEISPNGWCSLWVKKA